MSRLKANVADRLKNGSLPPPSHELALRCKLLNALLPLACPSASGVREQGLTKAQETPHSSIKLRLIEV